MTERYILDGKTAVPCDDLMTWARWIETANRHVATDYLSGNVRVSTVFIGLDHQFGDGPPLLFETMIFGGALDGYEQRYSTWDEAETGHAKALRLARWLSWSWPWFAGLFTGDVGWRVRFWAMCVRERFKTILSRVRQ